MIYAEASYFDGYHFAHIVAYEDHRRVLRIRKRNKQQIERRHRSRRRALAA